MTEDVTKAHTMKEEKWTEYIYIFFFVGEFNLTDHLKDGHRQGGNIN